MLELLFLPFAILLVPFGFFISFVLAPLGLADWMGAAGEFLTYLPQTIGDFFSGLFG